MDVGEIGREVVDWTHPAQDKGQWQALVYTIINLRVPQNAWNFLTSWVTASFWIRVLLYTSHIRSYFFSRSTVTRRIRRASCMTMFYVRYVTIVTVSKTFMAQDTLHIWLNMFNVCFVTVL
jgi:hypothetical protein